LYADDSSASLLRDCAAKATWPADLDPAVAIYRLETFFDEAQRLLRDDIPRHLMSTLRKVVEAMPDLAPFDALILPMGCRA
jgi:CHASE3 domain sensor protein